MAHGNNDIKIHTAKFIAARTVRDGLSTQYNFYNRREKHKVT